MFAFLNLYCGWTKNITPLKFLYVLGNMWEIKFKERSFLNYLLNHVIYKVNFMVITRVKRLMLPNILQSEQELHIWNPCQIACP